MKKALSLAMISVLCLSMLTACANSDPKESSTAPATEAPTTEAPTTETPTEAPTTEAPTTEAPTTEAPTEEDPTAEEPVGPIVGGWTVNDPAEAAKLPEDVQKAFDEAFEGFTGSGVTPIAYLGSQVVAGLNHAVLCSVKAVVPNATPALKIVSVNAPLEGKANILGFHDIDIASLQAAEAAGEALAGGWTVSGDQEAAVLPEEVQTAFEKATDGLTGSALNPIAYLGSKVVAGANYALLVTSTPIVPGANAKLCAAFVSAPVSGEPAIELVDLSLTDLLTDPVVEEPTAEEPVGPIVGGWTVNEPAEAGKLPEDIQKIFDEALDGFTGSAVTPIAYLGSQVVAGLNHAVLCSVKAVVPNATPALKIASINAPLEGKANILGFHDIDIASLQASEAAGEALAGGWTASGDQEAAVLPEEVQAAFEKATAGLTGSALNPIAYLGSQVVAGANYALLVTSTPIVPGEVNAKLCAAFVSAPVSGEPAIELVELNLTDLLAD